MIADRVAAGRPVLGICVGMQILFESGDEHGVVTKGLGLLPGRGHPARRAARCRTWAGTRSTARRRLGAVRRAGRRTRGSTSSTRTRRRRRRAGRRRGARDRPHPRRAVRRRGRARARWRRPSSTRRSPATPAPRCCATGCAVAAVSKERAPRRAERLARRREAARAAAGAARGGGAARRRALRAPADAAPPGGRTGRLLRPAQPRPARRIVIVRCSVALVWSGCSSTWPLRAACSSP